MRRRRPAAPARQASASRGCSRTLLWRVLALKRGGRPATEMGSRAPASFTLAMSCAARTRFSVRLGGMFPGLDALRRRRCPWNRFCGLPGLRADPAAAVSGAAGLGARSSLVGCGRGDVC